MYDHKKVEKEVLGFWEKNDIYEKVKKSREGGEKYYFCDGPPYATGQIHPGTGWNKCTKDAICRFQRGRGKDVRAQPGFDTHGLPIEVKVEKELGIQHKQEIEKYGVGKFISKCKEFATKYVGVMGTQFRALGVWMDWGNPYLTYKDDYIESSWEVIAKASDSGLLTQGVYVLPYCFRCETTMANYELEYGDETDPSIFVKFRLKGRDNEFLVIWTTTPWTIVENMAVMVHPNLPYVRVKVGNEVWVVAKDRMDYVLELTGETGTVLEEFIGKKLEKAEYEHPLGDKIPKEAQRRVILSDEYVTVEEGTGLVHTAPGTGPEDFIIGKRFGIEPFCPVDLQGNYTKEAGREFAGKNVRSQNPAIIKMLDEIGLLLHEGRITHRYPHCWRCKTPLIFLTTKQWFIEVSKLKDKMQEEIANTSWHPEFARSRFSDFVRDAPDWCISRQRYWGIPLPIWKCECGELKVVSSRKELGELKELHRPYIDEKKFKCPKCRKEMQRVPDVLDVWFDSGNAVWASLGKKEKETYSQADCILEGQDQIRGWFYSLLGSGVVRDGKCPYKRVLMHGFFVDEKGEKMSKSVGNFVPVEEILEKYGADSFRLWGLSNTLHEEQKFNWISLKEAHGTLDVLFNMYVYLTRFYPKKKITEAKLEKEDKWILSRLNNTRKQFNHSFENYGMNDAAKALKYFLVEDLSKFYMKMVKERISKPDGSGDGALFAIYSSLLGVLKMLSVISPFLPEHIYQGFYKKHEGEESISLYPLAETRDGEIDPLLEKQFEYLREMVSAFLELRQENKVKLRWPLALAHVKSDSQEVIDSVSGLSPILTRLINVKEATASEKAKKLPSADFAHGKIFLECEMSNELYSEAITNEITRRIQMLRKSMGLVEKDRVSVKLDVSGEFRTIAEANLDSIRTSTNSDSIEFSDLGGTEAKSWEIDGRKVSIAVEKTAGKKGAKKK